MPQKFANNARALLTGSITAASTSLTVEAGKADRFPVANTTSHATPLDWFKIGVTDTAGNLEVMYVGTRPAGSGSFSVLLRGQEGTTARSFAAGSFVQSSLTALDVQNVLAGLFSYLGVVGAGPVLEVSKTGTGAAAGALYINGAGELAFAQSNGSGGITADRAKLNLTTGLLTAADLALTSDERLKKDWQDVPADFLQQLAGVLCGTYALVDGGGARLVGVGAQSLQAVLAEGVNEDAQGQLQVRYGQVALVAAIQLAGRVLAIEQRLARLEAAAA
jgi:hypothetical protein